MMSRKAGARAVSDTGSMTGVATVILALLSAGTVASISLVGVHYLAPNSAFDRLRAGEPSAVRAPDRVVVTQRAATPVGESISHHRAAKPRQSAPSDVTVVPAVLTSPAVRVTTHTRHIKRPRVHVDRPAVTTPAVTAPTVTTPAVITPAVAVVALVATPVATPPPAPTVKKASPSPGRRDVAPSGPNRSKAVDAYKPPQQATIAVQGDQGTSPRDDSGASDEHAGDDDHDVDADRGPSQGQGEHGNDRGHGGGDSPPDHHDH
jgi:hypothetical protein